MEKLTDAEVMAALKCCIYDRVGCKGCPLYGDGSPNCWEAIRRNALDLIKRKNEEIERLKAEIRNTDNHLASLDRPLIEAKYDAYKEFANFLKHQIDRGLYHSGSNIVKKIDNLLKELTCNLHETCTEGGNEDGMD